MRAAVVCGALMHAKNRGLLCSSQMRTNMTNPTTRYRLLLALCVLCASVLHAGARSWIKGALHPAYTSMYLYLEDKYGSCHVADLVAYDLLTAITRHSTTNKMLQMFSKCLSGGLFDGHWMYMLRVMTLTKALYPRGFRNISDVQNFLIHQFYADQPPNEIDKVIRPPSPNPAFALPI